MAISKEKANIILQLCLNYLFVLDNKQQKKPHKNAHAEQYTGW